MDEKSLDVFARAKLFLYKTQLAKLGVGIDHNMSLVSL